VRKKKKKKDAAAVRSAHATPPVCYVPRSSATPLRRDGAFTPTDSRANSGFTLIINETGERQRRCRRPTRLPMARRSARYQPPS